MRYVGQIYRPPSEANSLLIQATIGCPHNRCSFCMMYKGTKFKFRPVEEIKEDLGAALEYYGPEPVRSLFFPDGNTIFMPTDDFEDVLKHATELFPNLNRITVYGSAKFVMRKSPDEFKRLKDAGLSRIHMGMETGSDRILKSIKKGTTHDQIVEAGKRVLEAGMELSEYIMVGIGGKEFTREHALESARCINEIDAPHFVRLRTTTPVPFSDLFEEQKAGRFTQLTPHEALKEVKALVENITVSTNIVSDHVSNYWDITGKLPDEKDLLLKEIRSALKVPEEKFRAHNLVRM